MSRELFTHPTFTHTDGTVCIWIMGGWFVPVDTGGEGYACEKPHPCSHCGASAIPAGSGRRDAHQYDATVPPLTPGMT